MTTKTDLPPIPSALSSVALIDAPTCAAAGGLSVSWWHEEVRAGRAPAPAVQRPRCTRWRLTEVADFWRDFASRGDAQAGAELTAKASKASAAAQDKRRKLVSIAQAGA